MVRFTRNPRPVRIHRHRAAPRVTDRGDVRTIDLGCIYCGRPVQRGGVMRRWRHVDPRFFTH
jgi:hypothetical protein